MCAGAPLRWPAPPPRHELPQRQARRGAATCSSSRGADQPDSARSADDPVGELQARRGTAHPRLPGLKELRLSGMLGTPEIRALAFRSERLSPLDFLALLLDDEIERRRRGAIIRNERSAGFEQHRLLAELDFNAAPTVDRRLMLQRGTRQHIARHEHWLIYGPTGFSKSHRAPGVRREAIGRQCTVPSAPIHRLATYLRATRALGCSGSRRSAC